MRTQNSDAFYAVITWLQGLLMPSLATPYSIRLTDEERAIVRTQAKRFGVKDAEFIRRCILKSADQTSQTDTRRPAKKINQTDMAQILALLGQSRIASNLNQIAKAIHNGTLDLSPAIEGELLEALGAVADMRQVLIKGTGLKGGCDDH